MEMAAPKIGGPMQLLIYFTDPRQICLDILISPMVTDPPNTLSDLIEQYNTTLSSILDKYAPLKSRLVTSRRSDPWFNKDLSVLKHERL